MTDKQFQLIIQFIKKYWESLRAWPDFIEAMRIPLPHEDIEPGQNDRWALLPGFCCQAAGGEPEFALEVSAAWMLLYLAGHLIDSVEDGDKIDEIEALGGSSSAINVANGYFLSAALMLNELSKKDHARSLAQQIRIDFYNTILVMTSGQNQDINVSQLSLKLWWQIAEAKSGSFFSLACRTGARLGTRDSEKIASFSKFGFHLGLMLQVQDDIEDLQLLMDEEVAKIPNGLMRSLTVAYAFDVLPEAEFLQLKELLERNMVNPEVVTQVTSLLDQVGAGLYLLAEVEKHYALGLEALQRAGPLPPAADELMTMLAELKLNKDEI